MTAPDGKLDTVRKLLAKADGAATPHEAEAYTAKATELIARHGIDVALLAESGQLVDEISGTRIEITDPYSAGKARLLAWTGQALRCRAVLHEARSGTVGAVTLFGFASDRERTELLYTSLLLQATTQLVRQRPPWRGESVAAYRRSWLYGFAAEVTSRLVAAEAAAEAASTAAQTTAAPGGPSTALVLASRTDQVDRAYAAAFTNLGRSRRSTLSGSGYGAGVDAGARADLSTARRVTGARRQIGA